MDLAERLEGFLGEFSDLERFENFFQELTLLNELQAFLTKFEEAYQKAVRAGHCIDVFDGFGIGRNEVRNCRVLAWLLDKNGSHGMGDLFLRKIAARLAGRENRKGRAFFLSDAALASAWASRTEICPLGEQEDRVDIVCAGEKLLLYVEVKIDAVERPNQTIDYYEKLKTDCGSREHALIFLSVRDEPRSGDAWHLTWESVASILLEMAGEKEGVCGFMRSLMRQYAFHIKHFRVSRKREGVKDAVQSGDIPACIEKCGPDREGSNRIE